MCCLNKILYKSKKNYLLVCFNIKRLPGKGSSKRNLYTCINLTISFLFPITRLVMVCPFKVLILYQQTWFYIFLYSISNNALPLFCKLKHRVQSQWRSKCQWTTSKRPPLRNLTITRSSQSVRLATSVFRKENDSLQITSL